MWEMLLGLLVWSLIGGVVPVVNAEAMVVVATLATSAAAVPVVAAVATVGQMIAKVGLYVAARWAPSRLPQRARVALQRGSEAIERRPGAVHGVILLSAVLGLPPFYGVSLAAGALRTSLQSFIVLGALGRGVRFGALAWAASRFGDAALDFLG
jgi:membrane protein YqaA with SNARE-associated domain